PEPISRIAPNGAPFERGISRHFSVDANPFRGSAPGDPARQLGHEEIQLSHLLHLTRRETGVVSTTPEDIDTPRPANCPTGVLMQHEAAHWAPPGPSVGQSEGTLRPNEGEHPRREQPRVRGDGAGRREWHPEAPEGRTIEASEEDDRRVVAEHARALRGVLRE